MIRPKEWSGMVRGLGESLVELAVAEVATLRRELGRNGKTLGVALGLAGGALFLGFWILGLGFGLLVALVAIWWPIWAAFATVLGVAIGVGSLLGFLALRRFRALQAPTELVRERWEDHVDWWQTVRGTLGPHEEMIEPKRGRRRGLRSDDAEGDES